MKINKAPFPVFSDGSISFQKELSLQPDNCPVKFKRQFDNDCDLHHIHKNVLNDNL